MSFIDFKKIFYEVLLILCLCKVPEKVTVLKMTFEDVYKKRRSLIWQII